MVSRPVPQVVADAEGHALGEDLLREIAVQVWESMLGRPAVSWTGEAPAGAPWLWAQVRLTGGWSGLVRVGCEESTAAAMTAGMLAADELSSQDVHDALGEVANVVGGNVKGSLPGHTALGLPQVLTGPARVPPGGAAPVGRCVVECAGAPVVLEVVAATPPADPAHPTSTTEHPRHRNEERDES
jgi:chemotaxis protein CheX